MMGEELIQNKSSQIDVKNVNN